MERIDSHVSTYESEKDESDYEFEEDEYDYIIDGWDYIALCGRDAGDKLYQARLARHRNIVLREFTRRIPNISEQKRNGLFDAFSRSDEFGPREHNALMDALADPKKGWNLQEY
jgi:hypothetical protein